MISFKHIFNVRNLATTLFMLALVLHVQGQDENNDAARNQRMATTSGGWVSGGIYTSHFAVGQNGISTLLRANDGQNELGGNFGFIVPLIEQVEPNQAPIAVTAAKTIFYNIGDALRLNGFDPDGDAIDFVITQAPANGELSLTGTTKGRFTFSPSSDLTPGTGYSDVLKFKVVEIDGEKLESDEATLPFTFNVADEPHEITDLSVSNATETSKSLNLSITDSRFNASYTVKLSYIDLTNPTAPTTASIVNEDFSLASFTQAENSLSLNIGVTQAEYPYLFSADQVVIIAEVRTVKSGFNDDDVFLLKNTEDDGSGGSIINIDTDSDLFADESDDEPFENTTSEDGLFFSFTNDKTTPENTSVAVNFYALELGEFDLAEASIAITSAPSNGSLSEPILVKTTTSLVQWTAIYTPIGDVGYEDSFEFSVTSAARESSVSATASIEVVDVNDAPTLSAIDNQLINEDAIGMVTLDFEDVDNEVSISATSSQPEKVSVTVTNGALTLTPVADFTGTVNISVDLEEVDTEEGYSLFESFELTVAPVNDAPIMASIDNQAVDEDNVFTYTLSATDVDATVPLFTYTATPDIQGAAEVSIVGNIMTVTPTADFNGTINFNITADDRLGTATSVSAVEAFALTVNAVNDAPISTATIPTQSMLDLLPAYVIDMGNYFEDVETADENLVITHDAAGTLFTLAVSGKNLTVTPIAGQSGTEDVTFTVSDGELSTTQTVTFSVETESAEINTTGIQDVSVDEDFAIHTIDLSGVFTDSNDPNAIFTYSIGGLSQLSGIVNGTNLEITTSSDFNGSENVFLIASANGKSSFTSFDINVNPVNDAPTLGTASNQSIQEDGQLSGVFMTFTDIDTDAANLEFTASSSDETLIQTDDIAISESATGITLSANTVANASGSTTITVNVTDGEFTSSQTFSVTVLSVNDVPTVSSTAIVDATEDAAYSQNISGLFADVDGDDLSFTLESNPEWLSIDNGSLVGTPTNDDVGSATFFITADDGAGGSVRQEYSINVANTNDAPIVATEAADINATEDVLLSSLISSSVFSDVDGDDLTLSASFTGATWLTFDATNNRFTGTPGNDDVGTVNITLTATDPDGASVSDNIVLTVANVNDTPTDLEVSALTVEENTETGTSIGSLSTVDIDAGDSFTYSLVSGSGSDNNDLFSISNGELVTNGDIDFESNATLSVRIQTEDAAGATFAKVFTVSVSNVNEAPTALAASSLAIDENAGTDAEVGTLSSTDPDNGDTFTYSLVSGTGDTDNSNFSISSGKLVAKNSLNFEAKSTYTVRVKTEDAGGLSYEEALSISVTNINEAPTEISIDASAIDENSTVGSAIGTLSTTDEDEGDSFTYSLASGSNDNDSFDIDGESLITASELDFETKASYTVVVTSTDAGGESFDKSITITVNNVAEPSIANIEGLVFDVTDIEETSTQNFTVENTGDTDIEVTSISLPNGYTANISAFTVAVGESTDVEVTFAPSEAITYAGEIVIQSNAGETRVNITGEGTIVTGIDDDIIDSDEIGLYPNPAQHMITIDLTKIPQVQPNLAIVDLNGNAVWTKEKVQERKVEVNVTSYPAGTYLIRVTSEKGSAVKKLIIIK